MVFDKVITGTYMLSITFSIILAMLLLSGCNGENGGIQSPPGQDPLEMNDIEDAIEPVEPDDSGQPGHSSDLSPDPDTPDTPGTPGTPDTQVTQRTPDTPDYKPGTDGSGNDRNALPGTTERAAEDTGTEADELREMEPGHTQTAQNGSVSDRPTVTIPPEVINPDYKALLNDQNELVVSGRSIDELLETIGEPLAMLRQGQRGSGWHREVWILPIYREDSTGLYLYFENGKVSDWRLDTFVGLGSHSGLLEWFQ